MPTTTTTTAAAVLTAAIAAAAAIVKKILAQKQRSKADHLTRAEFYQQLIATRDRVAACYTALSDKLDVVQRDLLAALDRQSTTIEQRLDQLESNIARLDERTRR